MVGLFSSIWGVARMDDSHLDAMLTLSQAAALIGRSRQLVYDWRERGLLEKDDDGRVSYQSVLDAEARTRNCQRPNVFKRKPKVLQPA